MMSLEAELERLAVAELERANKKFPLFASDHEGYAVILKEFEETEEEMEDAEICLNQMWGCVRTDRTQTEYIKHIRKSMLKTAAEAIQTAAMCEKFIQSQEERKYGDDKQGNRKANKRNDEAE